MKTATRRILILLLTGFSLLVAGCNIPIVPIVQHTEVPASGLADDPAESARFPG